MPREERPLAIAMLTKFRERLGGNDELIDVVSVEDMGALLNLVLDSGPLLDATLSHRLRRNRS